jgi:hypothetical protein
MSFGHDFVVLFGLRQEKDEDHETDQGKRFGESDSQEHRGTDHAGRLGLTGHGRDGVAYNGTDADARADGGKAIAEASADGLEAFEHLARAGLCENVEHLILLWFSEIGVEKIGFIRIGER